jgi:hypothetical protein
VKLTVQLPAVAVPATVGLVPVALSSRKIGPPATTDGSVTVSVSDEVASGGAPPVSEFHTTA